MTTLISPQNFTKTTSLLRSFFSDHRGFLEVHTQNRLSILAACEDPTTVSTYNYSDEVWPLPQTGQMWLEYELLKDPSLSGVFCVSTSYRQEQNPIKGRHDLIFPMFEFECTGDFHDLLKLESDLLTFLGFENSDHVPYENTKFPGGRYMDIVNRFQGRDQELTDWHEKWMYDTYGDAFFLTHFPFHTSPFWNMKTSRAKWKVGEEDKILRSKFKPSLSKAGWKVILTKDKKNTAIGSGKDNIADQTWMKFTNKKGEFLFLELEQNPPHLHIHFGEDRLEPKGKW